MLSRRRIKGDEDTRPPPSGRQSHEACVRYEHGGDALTCGFLFRMFHTFVRIVLKSSIRFRQFCGTQVWNAVPANGDRRAAATAHSQGKEDDGHHAQQEEDQGIEEVNLVI
jgi:hypothetical protein